MAKEPASDGTTLLSRGERLLLIVVATPFMCVCGFAAIVIVSRLVGYDLFGRGDWGIIPWGMSQFLASVALILALTISEGMRAGSLGVYTVLGCATGFSAWLLVEPGFERGLWIVPLQYSLIGNLLGRIIYRGVNRPVSIPQANPDADNEA